MFTGSLFSRGILERKHLNNQRSDCEFYAQVRIQFKSFSIEEKYDSSVPSVEWPDTSQLFDKAEYVMKNPVDQEGFFSHFCLPQDNATALYSQPSQKNLQWTREKTFLNLSNTLLSN